MREKVKNLLEIIFVVIAFLAVSYVVQANIEFFTKYLDQGFYGILIYIFVLVLALVLAPLSSFPLIPIAAKLWGPVATGFINVFAWTLGAVIIFYICREWGVKIIKNLVSLKELHAIEDKIPDEDEFWTIVFLRMLLPVDILSYALGLFTKIKFRPYVLSTIIGITPLAFVWAYVGGIPFSYQLLISLVAGIFVLIWMIIRNLAKD